MNRHHLYRESASRTTSNRSEGERTTVEPALTHARTPAVLIRRGNLRFLLHKDHALTLANGIADALEAVETAPGQERARTTTPQLDRRILVEALRQERDHHGHTAEELRTARQAAARRDPHRPGTSLDSDTWPTVRALAGSITAAVTDRDAAALTRELGTVGKLDQAGNVILALAAQVVALRELRTEALAKAAEPAPEPVPDDVPTAAVLPFPAQTGPGDTPA